MFDDSSRYASLETREHVLADGRRVVHLTRRFVPPKDVYLVVGGVTVTDSDRIDLVAHRAHGTPAGFWQIADANETMHPEILTAVPGRRFDPGASGQGHEAMNLLGVRLTVLIGPDPVAAPPPPQVLEALTEVEVTHDDRTRSGFQLTFAIGRSGPLDFLDYELVASPLLQVHSRVILVVTFDVTPRVIMDGLVTRRDILPGDEPGRGQLVLTGEDVSVALDREEQPVPHPGQHELIIATKIIGSYPQYGLLPVLPVPPPPMIPPNPIERTPFQRGTDWAYLEQMAGRFGYIVYVDSGPAPFVNAVHWHPPALLGVPQKALNVNLGPLTNVTSINFSQDGRATTLIKSGVKDAITGEELPVLAPMPTRPPLGLLPEAVTHAGKLRTKLMTTSGLNAIEAFARAFGLVNRSADDAIQVSGTLDSVRYNDALRARALVDLRGAGFSFDGTYVVRNVTHRISRGSYSQDFALSRSEIGAKLPVVRAA